MSPIPAVETLHPDVYVIEQRGLPRLAGTSANVAGFVGVAEKGPIDRAVFVTNMDDFTSRFGGRYEGSFLQPSVRAFFENGGRVAYVVRVLNQQTALLAKATALLGESTFQDSPASILGASGPFNLENGDQLTVASDADVGGTVVTFTATPGTHTGGGLAVFPLAALAGYSFGVQTDTDPDVQTVTLSGGAGGSYADVNELLADINGQVHGVSVTSAVPPGPYPLTFTTDTEGQDAYVTLSVGPPATEGLAALSLTAGTYSGGGNVNDIDAVTASEVESIMTAALPALSATVTVLGSAVRVQSVSTGPAPGGGYITISDTTGTPATEIGIVTLQIWGSAEGQEDTLKIDAISEGYWGNNLAITTQKLSTTVNELAPIAPAVGAPVVLTVSSLNNIEIGDVIVVEDAVAPGQSYVGVCVDVDPATVQITLHSGDNTNPGNANTIAVDAPIKSASSHRWRTTSTEQLDTGASELTVTSSASAVIGQTVTIEDGSTLTTVVITGVEQGKIKFAAVTLGSSIGTGANVVSQEFNLWVYEKGLLAESFTGLAMPNGVVTNEQDSVELRLAGVSNESFYVEVVDQGATPSITGAWWQLNPYPVALQSLASGNDGTDMATNITEYLGGEGPTPPKRGLYLLEDVPTVNFVVVPGITDYRVQVGLVSWCESASGGDGYVDCILDAPNSAQYDEPQEVRYYRDYVLNVDSSHAAFYYPWLAIVDDFNPDRREYFPPSGYMAGQWAAVGAVRGVHVSPANIPLNGVVDVAYRVNDREQDILHPAGINVIRFFPGQGIKCMGARTLTSVQDGFHYICIRRTVNFVKTSLREGMRWVIYEPNDSRLWNQMENVVGEFLSSMWARGMLYPPETESRAYFVKCDEETNPESERRAGRVFCEVGINPQYPAEFVIFRVGLYAGGTSISEEIARRG